MTEPRSENRLCQFDPKRVPHSHGGIAAWRVEAPDGWALDVCDAHIAAVCARWGTNKVASTDNVPRLYPEATPSGRGDG